MDRRILCRARAERGVHEAESVTGGPILIAFDSEGRAIARAEVRVAAVEAVARCLQRALDELDPPSDPTAPPPPLRIITP